MVTSCIVRQFYCKREARTERRLIEGNFLSAHAHRSNKLYIFSGQQYFRSMGKRNLGAFLPRTGTVEECC